MAKTVVDLSDAKWGKTQTKGLSDWQRRQKRSVRHHSRLVVSLKLLFPSLAALMVGLVILWPQMKAQQEEGISLLSSEALPDLPEDQAMINPRFFTVDENKEPLNLEAKRAFELPGKTRRIQLDEIRSDVLKQKEKWYALDAKKGIYTQANDTIELLEEVNLYTETGQEIETTYALFNVQNQDISGDKEVFIRLPEGYIKAQGFSITNQGELVKLMGQTRAVFYSKKKGD